MHMAGVSAIRPSPYHVPISSSVPERLGRIASSELQSCRRDNFVEAPCVLLTSQQLSIRDKASRLHEHAADWLFT